MRPIRTLGAALLLTLPAACGGSSSGAVAGTAGTDVTVFAASSLTNAFGDIANQYGGANGGHVTFSFAGSQDLVAQIQGGAPADVIATADTTTIRQVSDEIVGEPQTFAHNTLVIVTAPGNPKRITALADLVAPKLQVVLADPSVPAGKYAAQALEAAHVEVEPVSLELEVRAVVTKVELGEADAGIVYVTDAKSAGAKVSSVPVPHSPVASYAIAALDKDGEAFVDAVLSPAGQSTFRHYGFLPP